MASIWDRFLRLVGLQEDPMDHLPTMTPVSSSNLASAGYDDRGLVVSFKNGGTYRYKDADEDLYNGLMGADSKGRYFHQNVRSLGHQKLSTPSSFLRHFDKPDADWFKLLGERQRLPNTWAKVRGPYPEFASALNKVVRGVNLGDDGLKGLDLSIQATPEPSFIPYKKGYKNFGGLVTLHRPLPSTLAHEVGHAVDHARDWVSSQGQGWDPTVRKEIFANKWAGNVLGTDEANVPNLAAQTTYNNHYLRDNSGMYLNAFEGYIKAMQKKGVGGAWDGNPASWYRSVEAAGANPLLRPDLMDDPTIHRRYNRLVNMHSDTLSRQGFKPGQIDAYRADALKPGQIDAYRADALKTSSYRRDRSLPQKHSTKAIPRLNVNPSQVTLKSYDPEDGPELSEVRKLLDRAEKDPELSGYVRPGDGLQRTLIYHDGRLVGFMTPRKVNGGWRAGAMYVDADERAKYRGIGRAALSSFFSDKEASPVLIGESNRYSRKAFEGAGFKDTGVTYTGDDGWRATWFDRRNPKKSSAHRADALKTSSDRRDGFFTYEKLSNPTTWVHTSPHLLHTLEGRPYSEIADARSPEYMKKRLATDQAIAKTMGIDLNNRGRGFLHLALKGASNMRGYEDYPGFTYEVDLPDDVIEKTFFDVPLAHESVPGGVGKEGLKKALQIWEQATAEDKGDFGEGYHSRIEAYVPDAVPISKLYPQIEDRPEGTELIHIDTPRMMLLKARDARDAHDIQAPGLTALISRLENKYPRMIFTSDGEETKTSSYREGGSFTHDGQRYDMDTVLELTQNRPVSDIPVSALKWVLPYDTPDPERLAKADLSAPLLTALASNGKLVAVDGLHRTTKAVHEGVSELPTRIVGLTDLALARIEKPELNKWFDKIKEEAQERGLKDFFAVGTDPSHPLGGGSIFYGNQGKPGPARNAREAHMKWEEEHGHDPDHDWNKTSEVITPLKPHQERVVSRIGRDDQPGLVVYHGLGSGKTLASIAAAESLGGKTAVYLPAALRANYAKELDKHTARQRAEYVVDSIQRVARGHTVDGAKLAIVDEAHRARNPSSATHQQLAEGLSETEKRLLLSATPVYNHPADLAALVNLAAGESILPTTPGTFEEKYVKHEKVQPSLWARLRGVKPGVRKKLKNEGELGEILGKWVDFHRGAGPGAEGFPGRTDEIIDVPMTSDQGKVYEGVIGANPDLAYKVRKGLPPSKSEASQLNRFANAARQVANTTAAFVGGQTPDEALANAPKIREAVARLVRGIKSNPRHKAVVYSNYLDSGLNLYGHALEKEGIPFETFTGKVKDKDRKRIVDAYNQGAVKALLLSSAGGEGLDLKGTRQVQVLEPHWNDPKLEQVIGRAIRYKSHDHLPPGERTVAVEHFNATLPDRTGLMAILKGKKVGDMAIDAYLRQLAGEKSELQGSLEALIEQGQAKYSAAGDNFVNGPLDLNVLPLEERFIVHQEDPPIQGAHDFGVLTGLARAPGALDHGLRQLDLMELADLEARQPTRGLTSLLVPSQARFSALREASERIRAPSVAAHPVVGLTLLTGLYDMEQASLEGDTQAYIDARDRVMGTAQVAAGLDALISGGDALAQLRTTPARMMAGQGVGDALRAAGKSALRRPAGSLGRLVGLTLIDQLLGSNGGI